ncbi:hypothetical protein SAMN02745166_01125 [Prosthecobacter debontii]|uniref:Uncharacterized protein n=2 Tax=Prosthecobacter debontii TaxID=48467 RepID=A0A1T4X769_9BACT|nr:hypothetical protein SAMN02745166_01125 [Prosthecobacter debontii]
MLLDLPFLAVIVRRIIFQMKRLWQILAFILLALMVPSTVCCLVPQEVEKQHSGCCSHGDEGDEAPAMPDICTSDTLAQSYLPEMVTMPEMQMVELIGIIQAFALLDLAEQAATPVPMPTTAPPELRTTWVFVSRAALPARAPAVPV